MTDSTAQELLRLIRRCYPAGFPRGAESFDAEGKLPYQHTPEYQHWVSTWMSALHADPPPWMRILTHLKAAQPGEEFGTYTPVCQAACYVLIHYLRLPRRDGAPGERRLRLAGAVSLVAPVYLLYCAEDLPHSRSAEVRIPPPEEVRPHAAMLAQHIEHATGYSPLPPTLARVPVEGVRVFHLENDEQPTLLTSLFMGDLGNLP
ncbi:hypothetical protein P2318_14195 [Myxococcaceae bacterium GXIMD 01537]